MAAAVTICSAIPGNTDNWRMESGNAAAELGASTKMATSAGRGQLNRIPKPVLRSESSYRRLTQTFIARSCRSAEVSRKDGGKSRAAVYRGCQR